MVFSSLSNETRLRCLYLIARQGEVCVCEAVDTLQVSQPTISKAFKTLKEAGLVVDRRDTNWIYYRINEDVPEWVAELMASTIKGLSSSLPYTEDERRFANSVVRATERC